MPYGTFFVYCYPAVVSDRYSLGLRLVYLLRRALFEERKELYLERWLGIFSVGYGGMLSHIVCDTIGKFKSKNEVCNNNTVVYVNLIVEQLFYWSIN